MSQGTNITRPAVLYDITETQMQELERQFEEQDRQGWKRLTDSYGWSEEESEAVWEWFSVQPVGKR
jgi:hypothetical protein